MNETERKSRKENGNTVLRGQNPASQKKKMESKVEGHKGRYGFKGAESGITKD